MRTKSGKSTKITDYIKEVVLYASINYKLAKIVLHSPKHLTVHCDNIKLYEVPINKSKINLKRLVTSYIDFYLGLQEITVLSFHREKSRFVIEAAYM